jgi:hypothetical protein
VRCLFVGVDFNLEPTLHLQIIFFHKFLLTFKWGRLEHLIRVGFNN